MGPAMVHPASYGQVIEYIQGMKQNIAPLSSAVPTVAQQIDCT